MTRAPLPPGYVDVSALLGTRAPRHPRQRVKRGTVRPIVPFDAATLWRHVKAGAFPAPTRTPGGLAWRLVDVRQWRPK